MKSHLYVFGSGDCGQLGMGEDVDMAKKPRLHPFFEKIPITDIAAGGLHSLALSSSGEVYSWGCNDEKALGHCAAEFTVAKVEGLEGVRVVQVSAGDSISAALSEDGKVYTWGTFRDSKGVLGHHHHSIYAKQQGKRQKVVSSGEDTLLQDRPMLIESLLPYKIVNIAAGSNHLTAVTEDGQLFAWGSGEQGQLGRRVLERHKNLGLKPTNVTPRIGRRRIHVKQAVCGSYHTLVFAEVTSSKLSASQSMSMLTSSQDSISDTVTTSTPTAGTMLLLSMGLNNYGQLGLADHDDRMIAELIDPSNWSAVPIAASAGEHHSLVLCADGNSFAFGRGDSGQLGVSLPEGVRACNTPVTISTVNEPLALIAAGGNHNMAVGFSGRLYTWGYGEMHQLGHGPDNIESFPRPLDSPFHGKIAKISAGGQHSLVLTQSD